MRSGLAAIVILCGGLISSVHADAIVRTQAMAATTIAEYFVDDRGVRLELEIGAADLPAFHDLLPDALLDSLEALAPGDAREPYGDRLQRFFAREMIVANGAGESLPGRLESLEVRPRVLRDSISGEPLTPAADAEQVLFAVARYPVERPSRLRLSGPRSAGVGFVVYHRGIPVNDFRYLGKDYALELDWSDPWYSSFTSRNLQRAYAAAMSGFLYVEPFEVRKEIIVRPLDLQTWLELGVSSDRPIRAAEQPRILEAMAGFLEQRQPVRIDGQTVEPRLARIHFLRRTLRNSTVIDPPEDLDALSAVVGAIFVYPIDGLPQRVTLDWDLFNERVAQVPVAAVDEAGPLPGMLTPEDSTLVWQNFLRQTERPMPVETAEPPPGWARPAASARWVLGGLLALGVAVSLLRARRGTLSVGARVGLISLGLATVALFVLARTGHVTDGQRGELVRGLLHNVYHAFDYGDEERIYDQLALSVSGPLLTEIYLEVRHGLELRSQGGARTRVETVELHELTTEPDAEGGFLAQASWDVSGSVGHWGHVHRRVNRYRAELGIRPEDGRWKLVALDVIDEQRLDPSRPGGAS